MHIATVRDLRNRYSGLLKWIGSGEEVLITRRGKAIAKLVPAFEMTETAADWSQSPVMASGRRKIKKISAVQSRQLIKEAGGPW